VNFPLVIGLRATWLNDTQNYYLKGGDGFHESTYLLTERKKILTK